MKTKIKASLKKDVLAQIGSIYRLNSPYGIGYLFNSTEDGKKIDEGMFCDYEMEIDKNRWEYMYRYSTKKIEVL